MTELKDECFEHSFIATSKTGDTSGRGDNVTLVEVDGYYAKQTTEPVLVFRNSWKDENEVRVLISGEETIRQVIKEAQRALRAMKKAKRNA